ncbi:MAG: hypothetical protein WBL53_07950 [Pseudonocardiaceae bacterium]|jgi:hypothetical protein
MTTITRTTEATCLVYAAELLAAHLADHQLPPPASLTVVTRGVGCSEVTAQLRSFTLSGTAADLLAWADTLTTVTIAAWRPPRGNRVHLSITSTLTGPVDTVELEVFGGVDYCPTLFADLESDERRAVTLASLRTWASSTSTDTPVLDMHWGER